VRRTPASFTLLALAACGADASSFVRPAVRVPGFVRLVSDPAESLGGGGTYDYSTANALVTVRPFGAQLAMRVVGDRVWDGFLALSSADRQLRAGTFESLTNTPSLGAAGFRWSSQEVTCGATVATVTIDTVRYNGEELRAIDLHFEQRCDGQSAALRGTVHWRAEDDPNASGPVVPVPAALWRAPAGAIPAKGPYIHLDGTANLGTGLTLPQTIVPTAIVVRATGAKLSIVASDSVSGLVMSGTFQEMVGQTAILEGYYRDLRGLSELPTVGALDVGVDGWDCDSLVGWFVVDHQFYFQGGLTVIDLRFEVRCKGLGAPLRGQIHWAESGA